MGPSNYWSCRSVIRTLLDGSNSIITVEEDRRNEEEHIRTALHTCGYLDWAISRVKDKAPVVQRLDNFITGG